MYPGYRFADAYPHQRNPMPTYMPNYYPGFEAPEMKMDPFKTPSTYEAWPHGGCHGCCNHSYMPGYTEFRPPYPPYMQPPPFHGYGGYPMYPMHYTPPPHYPMTQPRYEYDKPMDHHCCGCSNHQVNRKEDKPVRIEEQEPEAEKGKNGNTSLVPVDFHKDDYPYPVMWIPPGYMKNGEDRKLPEPETKNSRPSEHKPDNTRGVWFPFDIKNLGGAVENGKDLKRTEEEKTVDKNQFPFPIFWMPYKPAEEEGKEKTEAPSGSESTKTLSTVQSKSLDERSGVDGSSKPVESKVVKLKTIPVKQLEEPQEKEMKERDNAVKSSKPSSEKKPSPPNTSKLPPVCLRVEPLKRSRSVGSRSPSPPGDKEKSPRDGVRSSSSIMEKTRDVQRNEGNGLVEEKKSTGSIKPDNAATEAGNANPKEAKGQTVSQEVSNAANESCKEVKRKNLSDEEAALIIQAAFRGFGVRKWEPLKKLKQIASVKEQAIQVKNRIEGFELSGDVSIDKKEKLVIGETIMSLLLKLDTIQGLHPMVRDIRKAEAKELVSLQEKLDSLPTEKPSESIASAVVGLQVEDKDSTLLDEQREAEELHASPKAQDTLVEEKKECNDSEDMSSVYPLRQGEELQSVIEEDIVKSEPQQKDEPLNSATAEDVDCVAHSTPDVADQNAATEESQDKENVGTCECEVVQGEEKLSPQADELTSINNEAAEDKVKAEDDDVVSVKVTEPELFDYPSTEANEVIDLAEVQVPQTEESQAKLASELAFEENGSTDECNPGLALEEEYGNDAGRPQLEGNVDKETPLGDASGKDESVQDKEVLIEEEDKEPSQEASEHNANDVEAAEEKATEDKQSGAEEKATEDKQSDQKLLEENQRLKKMMQELIEAGKDQLSAITDLSGKVKYLERKLARKKKVKTRRTKSAKERIEDIGV